MFSVPVFRLMINDAVFHFHFGRIEVALKLVYHPRRSKANSTRKEFQDAESSHIGHSDPVVAVGEQNKISL